MSDIAQRRSPCVSIGPSLTASIGLTSMAAAALARLPPIQRLSPRVICVLGFNPSPMTLQGTNTYLVGTGRSRILIDTGDGRPEYLAALRQLCDEEHCSIGGILLTHVHWDHVGGLADVLELAREQRSDPFVRKARHSERHAKWPDAPHAAVCRELSDGDVFDVEGASLRVLATPGHTSDSVSFVLDREVFVGDCVLGQGTAVVSDLEQYEASLLRLIHGAFVHLDRSRPSSFEIADNGWTCESRATYAPVLRTRAGRWIGTRRCIRSCFDTTSDFIILVIIILVFRLRGGPKVARLC